MTKASTLSELILKRIRTNVYTGKVPSERALAEEFSVNFKTANRAIGLLVEQGTLIRKRGEGTFIAPAIQRRDLTIGLCFFKYTDPGRDPVFNRFLAGLYGAVQAQGLRLEVTAMKDVVGTPTQEWPNRVERFEQAVLSRNPDGLLYLGNIEIALIKRLREDRPTIVVAETPAAYGFDSVRRDIHAGTGDAVRRFAAAGHRQIAYLTPRVGVEDYDRMAKQAGYRDAMRDCGLAPQVMEGPSDGVGEVVQRLAASSPRPTAAIVAEANLALGLLDQARAQGLRIPEDLRVDTFDDGDVGAITQPRLSSIHAFGEDLAHLAVQRLVDRLDGKHEQRIDEQVPCPYISRQPQDGPAMAAP